MDSCGLISVNSSGPIDFELQNQGRVLLIKDALYHSLTHRYQDIRLERNGWRFFGVDLGGGGRFTGITEDVVREIQATYGIALKTLPTKPNSATFSSSGQHTSYQAFDDSGKWGEVKTSYPLGGKKDDLFLREEDARRFGKSQMTLHDAMNAGIWHFADWSKRNSLSQKTVPPISSDSTSRTALRSSPPTRTPQRNEEAKQEKKARSSLSADSRDETPASEKKKRGREKGLEREIVPPVTAFSKVPAYRAKSTPIEPGYDEAPIEERKRRMIAHLDRSSPIPFSAFVDGNLSQKIEQSLFLKMSDGLRRLAANPKASDKDAKYMRELCEHWFRAGYHYLDQNSKPGDGYAQIFSQVAEKIKDRKRAEAKAKELYWRQHATDFWMTFIDLFAEEKIDIDSIRKFLATQVPLNFWF